MTATLKSIAQDARVAMSTVSYILSGTGLHKFSEETCRKVLESAERLNYRPNLKARALCKGRTYVVGALFRSLTYSFVPNIIEGFEHVMESNGFCLMLATYTPDNFTRKCNYLYQHGVEGVAILPSPDITVPDLGDLERAGIPVISIADSLGNRPKVMVANEETGSLPMNYLADHGHTVVAYAGVDEARRRGITKALDRHRHTHCHFMQQQCHPLPDVRETFAWLKSLSPFPTAVICDSDTYAVALIQCATQDGLRIPEDLSVMGIDGMDIGNYSLPPLTTVAQQTYEHGIKAGELLLDAINGKEVRDCIMQPTIIERQSCRTLHPAN
ncbi:MAG: LacI family DNA-binding transcriptional regulator [Victivallales bacterium]|nr:LacI family DNA-binding transcriptional regulator [Victivallales bacterium]